MNLHELITVAEQISVDIERKKQLKSNLASRAFFALFALGASIPVFGLHSSLWHSFIMGSFAVQAGFLLLFLAQWPRFFKVSKDIQRDQASLTELLIMSHEMRGLMEHDELDKHVSSLRLRRLSMSGKD